LVNCSFAADSPGFPTWPKQTAKKLQNLKNEFVKFYIVLQERIKHMNVKFELLWQNREAAEWNL